MVGFCVTVLRDVYRDAIWNSREEGLLRSELGAGFLALKISLSAGELIIINTGTMEDHWIAWLLDQRITRCDKSMK